MKNWDQVEEGIPCQAEQDWQDVQRVCDHLGMERHRVNFVAEYWNEVFETVLAEFRKGLTPNPDILCNREIKFKAFFDKALSLGATQIATGHYCRVGGANQLLRGTDQTKDQSYFLAAITSRALERTFFPIGHLKKSEVKRIAREHGLITAAKKESMGICFIGKRKFEDFIGEYIKQVPGELRLADGGEVIGEHRGICTLTIGQGARVGGRPEKLFVVAKDVAQNIIYVTPGSDSPLLFTQELRAFTFNWISGQPPEDLEVGWRCEAQVRYLHKPGPFFFSFFLDPRICLFWVDSHLFTSSSFLLFWLPPATPCTVKLDPEDKKGEALLVRFDEPVKAITPGQTIVFYQGDVCLGCATVAP